MCKKSVVLSYFKISSVSIVTEEVMKSRMDGEARSHGWIISQNAAVVSVAINLRLLAQTDSNTLLMSAM